MADPNYTEQSYVAVLDSPGSTTFTMPAGTVKAYSESIGGGGGGSHGDNAAQNQSAWYNGSGGGGGQWAKSDIQPTVGGDVWNVVVGAGGIPGQAGGQSYCTFGQCVSSGAGGQGGTLHNGGDGGNAGQGVLTHKGGDGADGGTSPVMAGGGGGGAGRAIVDGTNGTIYQGGSVGGGNGGHTEMESPLPNSLRTDTPAEAGHARGAGGGGGAWSCPYPDNRGKSGASGEVRITYTIRTYH